MIERVEIQANELRIGDRLTEWCFPPFAGIAEGPGERVSELEVYPGPDGADMVEAWTETGVVAGMPAINCVDWQTVTVWRGVSR